MDLYHVRRKRLRQWIDSDPVSLGVVKAWCSYYSRFTEKPLNPVYIRQLVPKRGSPKSNIGERTARALEVAGGKLPGWLDGDDEGVGQEKGEDSKHQVVALAASYSRSPSLIAAALEHVLLAHGLSLDTIIDGGKEAAANRIAEAIYFAHPMQLSKTPRR